MFPPSRKPPLENQESRRLASVRHRLSRAMLRSVGQYELIEEGDRILVAVSGGKDSYTLLELLWRARRKSPISYEILAFHLDQAQPGHDVGPLSEWLEASEIPHRIHREDTYSLVKKIDSGSSAFCSTCSRFRRGILYTWAERLDCNKIALGHHREDALETLLLNLFYAGRLQAMPAAYTTNDGRFRVIRPLIECAEADIAEHATLARYPILPCGLCGSQLGLKRDQVARILNHLEREIPDVRRVMLGALKNVRATHLLDREVAEAWLSQADRYRARR